MPSTEEQKTIFGHQWETDSQVQKAQLYLPMGFFAQGNTNSFANSFKASFISWSLQNTTTGSLFKVVSGIRTILASPDLVTDAFSEIGTVWRGGKEILRGLPPQHCIDDHSCVAKDQLFKTTHARDDIFA